MSLASATLSNAGDVSHAAAHRLRQRRPRALVAGPRRRIRCVWWPGDVSRTTSRVELLGNPRHASLRTSAIAGVGFAGPVANHASTNSRSRGSANRLIVVANSRPQSGPALL